MTRWVSFVRGTPVRYTDSSGHCIDGITTWVCIIAIVGFVSKVVDYGWTAYDGYQSARIIADPNANRGDKMMAGLNVGLAALFEAAEPDDLLPLGLPLDDAARKVVMKGAKEAFEEGGEEAVEKYLRDTLGEHADDVLEHMGIGKGIKNAWSEGGSNSVEEAIEYHFRTHPGKWKTPEEYTKAAQNFWAKNRGKAKEWTLSTGEMGYKIDTGGYFGIYTADGHIVSFGISTR